MADKNKGLTVMLLLVFLVLLAALFVGQNQGITGSSVSKQNSEVCCLQYLPVFVFLAVLILAICYKGKSGVHIS